MQSAAVSTPSQSASVATVVEVASASLQSSAVSTPSQSPSMATVLDAGSVSSQSLAWSVPSPSASKSLSPPQSESMPSYQVSVAPG